ncbi:hypothetical protein D9M73_110690 [compost metagenome]
MPTMGRRRKTDDHGLEPRVYQRRGAFYYVHRDGGAWEPLGKDKDAANRKAKVYNDPDGLFGTVVYWMEKFLIDCEARVKAGNMAKRTYDDYAKAIRKKDTAPSHGALSTYFKPPMTPRDVTPNDIQAYINRGLQDGRAVQANREKACFSSFMGWLITSGKVPDLLVNPCLEGSGVRRNPESKRDLYVTHEDYRDVFAVATRSERLLMELTYRTLQRPESDIVLWTTAIVKTEGGRRKLDFIQNKTGTPHKIGFSQAMEDLIPRREGNVIKLAPEPLVKTLKGEHYTYSGLNSMLRRSITKANKIRQARGDALIPYFGYRDLKGKGATDMYYLAKVPLEQIQQLLGHKNRSTTEIYIKARHRETAEPNMVVMA